MTKVLGVWSDKEGEESFAIYDNFVSAYISINDMDQRQKINGFTLVSLPPEPVEASEPQPLFIEDDYDDFEDEYMEEYHEEYEELAPAAAVWNPAPDTLIPT